MRCIELFETPEADLASLRQAQRAASLFSGWLVKTNETTPLDETGMLQAHTVKGDQLWLVSAREVGVVLPSVVYFGVGWNPQERATRAYVTTSTIAKQPVILLIMMLTGEAPGNKTDVAFSIRWNDFIHEFTHVLDYQRGYLKHKSKQERTAYQQQSAAKYYNSAIEFNAFYKQGLDKMLNKLAQLASASSDRDVQHFRAMPYQQFKKLYGDFDSGWLAKINKTYRQKFEKRLYRLYHYVQQTWPDVAAIRDHQAEVADNEARLDAEQAQHNA